MQHRGLQFAATVAACSLVLSSCSGGGGSPPLLQAQQTTSSAHRSVTQASCIAAVDFAFRPSAARERLQPAQLCNESSKGARGASSERHAQLRTAGSAGITTFDVPGSATAAQCEPFEIFFDCGTNVEAVNNAGEIAGFYLDSQLNAIAYIRSKGGQFTTFNAPGAGNPHLGTSPYSLSNSHIAGGYFLDSQDFQHSFIRSSTGSFITYDVPFVLSGSDLANLNARGEAAGHYFDSFGNTGTYLRLPDGAFVNVVPPDSLEVGICPVDCMNEAGAVTGNFLNSKFATQSYIRNKDGAYTVIDVPGSAFTSSQGINSSGTTGGYWNTAANLSTAWIRNAQGKFTFFQAPDASLVAPNGTVVLAINNSGAVAGLYTDVHSTNHGYYRSSTGAISEFDPSGSVDTVPTGMNDLGEVTGFYYDSLGQVHGFLWQPH